MFYVVCLLLGLCCVESTRTAFATAGRSWKVLGQRGRLATVARHGL